MTQESESVNVTPAAKITETIGAQEIMDGKTCVKCGFRCIQGCV